MIIALPVMQLFLFGYAINADPKHLPTGLLSAGSFQIRTEFVAALKNTGYYDIRAAVVGSGSRAWPGRRLRCCS